MQDLVLWCWQGSGDILLHLNLATMENPLAGEEVSEFWRECYLEHVHGAGKNLTL